MDPLGEVEIGRNRLAVDVEESRTENGDLVVALELEADVFAGAGETAATPLEGAYGIHRDAVKVELCVNPFTLNVGKAGPKDGAVERDVLGRLVERHGD
ncbi:unnamed protein product [Parascedosporium putredinis]|uniref:Uncharacterized protein n=1 Tax=Parascedosporium putredinis TaxID=1442378 RepID=A0A9P1M8H1_9PEZI|nr:unnamed protein product [Parascedosporium putredinis]CAI7992649.1 unnamed protein product [Parascedosporium putredinis]